MQNNSTLILTLVMAAGTILTRFLPFILFPDGKQMPRYVEYLGNVLPYATMGILVVYCLKGVSLFSAPFGIPEFLACALVAVLHAWSTPNANAVCSSTLTVCKRCDIFFFK